MMVHALMKAKTAFELGEVPVACVIVTPEGSLLASSHNLTETKGDPTAHAEMLALQEACRKTGNKFLEYHDLYVTLEPCPMCAAAISLARIRRVYFGAYDPKSGGIDHGPRIYSHPTCHHVPETYGGIMESECASLLQEFFSRKR